MGDQQISLLFYRYLCNVIGTEDVVRIRRDFCSAQDNVYSSGLSSHISSGSKAEGLDIDGSDFDLMDLANDVHVYEDLKTIKYLSGTRSLLMNTLDCKPGYTKLKLIADYYPYPFIQLCEYKDRELYMSSAKYRELYCSYKELDLITHGPCKSTSDGTKDFVRCIKCNGWILQAQSWLSRRQHQWASDNVIDTIVKFGVLFVPIGSKNSKNANLEWRISFSFAEKLLIWSFNHVQLMCYALLKILLKEVIKHFTGDLLCSYFLKTIMFWICEETTSYQWEAKNILSCFMRCFDRLIYCVQYNTCVHYFIPENDLFDTRFNRQQQQLLLSTLNKLRNFGWTCLLQTNTLKSFYSFQHPFLTPILNCGSYLNSYLNCWIIDQLIDFRIYMIYAVYCCLRSNKLDFYLHFLSSINCNIGEKLLALQIECDSNKNRYNIFRKRLFHLLIGLNCDAVSGWLILASFFYVNKQYHVCNIIISDCLSKCSLDKYIMTHRPSKEEHTRFELLRRLTGKRPYSFLKQHSICHVSFRKHSQIIPEEISLFGMENDIFSPVVFGWFLKYLCNHHLGNRLEKDECLQILENVIEHGCFICSFEDAESAYKVWVVANSINNVHRHS